MGDKLERLHKLPLQADLQSDRYLVAGVDILALHLEQVLTTGGHTTESNIRVSDVMLSSRKELEIPSLLGDCTIVCGDIKTSRVVECKGWLKFTALE